MNRRPHTGLVISILALLHAASGSAADLKNRSISGSGQFIVYCDDREVRSRVVSAVEEAKTETLRVLHERDDWKFPIVVSLEPAAPEQQAPVTITLVSTVAGPKVDVAVRVGDDPSKVFLERHIVRALLLEMAYRDRAALKGSERYAEPPWWLAEGIVQMNRNRRGSGDPEIFKSIVDTAKLPPLEKFLSQPSVQIDSAAGAVDRACAFSLIRALLQLPNGPQNLGRFLRAWPDAGGDALGALAIHFPVLAESDQSLAKWWTLQLAGLAKSDQWRGLSPTASETELRPLLKLDVVVDKTGRRQQFALSDFEQFLKMPGAKTALRTSQIKIAGLISRSDAFFQPILAEYEEICRLLSAGKTKGIAQRLADMERYRSSVLQRAEKIADYMNWYEATQTPGATGEFDKYLRTVESMTPKPQLLPPTDPKISAYLDSFEADFAPLRPNMIPGVQPAGNATR